MPDQSIETFVRRITPLRDVWRSIDLRFSTIRHEHGWSNFVTEFALSSALPDPRANEDFVQLPNFKAGRRVFDASLLDGILASLESDLIRVVDVEIPIRRWANDGRGSLVSSPPLYQTSISEADDKWRGFWTYSQSYVSFSLSSYGSSIIDLISQDAFVDLGRALLAYTPSYSNLDDLLTGFLRARQSTGRSSSTRLEISAPIEARIESVQVGTDATAIKVSGPETMRSGDVRVLARGLSGSGLVRYDVSPLSFTRTTAGATLATIEIATGGHDWLFGTYLFRNEKVGEFQIAIPSERTENPRLAAIRTTESGYDRLRNSISGDPASLRRTDAFELAVSWLLTACGFQVLVADLKTASMGDSADLYAFVPYSTRAFVIEATSRDLLADGKLVKLKDRGSTLGRMLPGSAVTPVAVTAKDSISQPEWDMASALGVIPISVVELGELLELAEGNQPVSKSVELIDSIPNRPRGTLPSSLQ